MLDSKTSRNSYNLTKSELRKFKEYTNAGKQWAKAGGTEIQYFLIIAPSFKGQLEKKAEEFQSDTGIKLVCTQAGDICEFTNKIREVTQNASAIRLVKWRSLLSRGKPLLEKKHFDKTIKDWLNDIKKTVDI